MRTALSGCLVFALTAVLLLHGEEACGKLSEEVYGRELPMLGGLGLKGAMDATVVGDRLYVIGGDTLYVADITRPAAPKLVGRLAGLGFLRQIEVHRGVAYITARQDGMFLVDVRRPDQPRLLCHYDTIELATGIALSGDVAFVACRTAGVELVDISNPSRPVHLSTVRTGEAQSVVARDGVLYAGVWGSRELVVCDVKNPYQPHVIAKAPLDGFGDGVCLRGKYCFVATGHHSRGLRWGDDEESPHFGHGHGMEILDVSDPARPVFVSRIKMPPFYHIGMDMWDVMVAGDYAFVSDTYNGVFVVDISDVQKPRHVGHRQLEPLATHVDGQSTGRTEPAPVGGIALAKDVIYVAGAWTDLYVVEATGMARTPEPEPDKGSSVPTEYHAASDARFRIYKPQGQVYGVAFSGDTALVAAGAAGLHAVQLWPSIERLGQCETEGFARDVAVAGGYAYVAESEGGLSIRKLDGTLPPKTIACYRTDRGAVQQVVVPGPGRYALLHVGQNELQIVDVSDPLKPALVLHQRRLGLFYTYAIANGLLEDRYAAVLWHVSGYGWFDLYGGTRPIDSGDGYPHRSSFANGMAILGDRALMVTGGKYALIDRHERRPPGELTLYGVEGCRLAGKATVAGHMLYLADRVRGTVQAVDITNAQQPRLVDEVQLAEHPSPVVVQGGIPIIPGGYEGLLVWERKR